MTQQNILGRLEHLTFKGNLRNTRYGWLRLTPAYSVHLVADLLERECRPGDVVLDPFCGTGTTALVCAERGVECDTTDINPFLLWLAHTKTSVYAARHLLEFRNHATNVSRAILRKGNAQPWTPPLHQIEKWWSERTLAALGRAMSSIRKIDEPKLRPVADLLRVAFCRTMIDHADVSFGHQSMSFKKGDDGAPTLPLETVDEDEVAATWNKSVDLIVEAAKSKIDCVPSPIHCDARDLRVKLRNNRYGCVITSPPYPNRMSYIRELRPYMYWLGYLSDGRQAGELDWEAIGGTWGCATSNVAKWVPDKSSVVPFDGFADVISAISSTSKVLGRYVEKYFHDMVLHCESLFNVVAPGGSVHYIVGNSKFYDVMLPVERIYAAMFLAAGFRNAQIKTIRKRTSKKELFEFVVSASKP
jgi:hypothetical protein